MDNQALMEAFQRRAARQGGQPGMQAQPGMQPQQYMSEGGADQLQKSEPGEAMLILKALIQRLRQIPPEGGNYQSPSNG